MYMLGLLFSWRIVSKNPVLTCCTCWSCCSAEVNLFQDQEDFDRVANGIMDEAVNEVTREYLAMEQEDAAAERAAAHIDNPTLENILQALERMEVCQCWKILSPPLSLPPLN